MKRFAPLAVLSILVKVKELKQFASSFVQELTEELVGMDFTELLWASRGSAGNRFPNVLDDLMGLMDKFGWFSGDVMESMIDELIERKTGLKGTTFKQMKEWNGGKVRLRITAVCVNTQRLMWLDADTAPDMSIAKAGEMGCGE